MKSTRIQAAIVTTIAALIATGAVVADESAAVKSRIYLEGQTWTGSAPPDSAYTKGGVLKSRRFDSVANDTVAGPAPTQGSKLVGTVSWDNAPVWAAREGGPTTATTATASTPAAAKHASK